MDDANIYFVYAKNFLLGEGFVYYSGGERVEGFTSLLWEWICIGAWRYFEIPVYALLALSAILSAVAVFALGSTFFRDRMVIALLGLWAVANPAFLIWNISSLMDMSAWGCAYALGFAALARFEREDSAAKTEFFCLTILVALLVRPEAHLVVAVWLALRFLFLLDDTKSPRAAIARLAVPITLAAVLAGGLMIFRLLYFGFPFPNTYYAKVSSDTFGNLASGVAYLSQVFFEWPVMYLVAGLTSILLYQVLRRGDSTGERRRKIILVSAIVLALFLPVLTGGDHFAHARFYALHWPLFGVGLAAAMLGDSKGYRVARLAAFFVVITIAGVSPRYSWFDVLQGRASLLEAQFSIAQHGHIVGASLNRHFEGRGKLPSIGVTAAGGIALVYDGPVIDMLGLNNTAMAHADRLKRGIKNHAGFHRETFFAESPEIVIPAMWFYRADEIDSRVGEMERGFENEILSGLLTDTRFRAEYNIDRIEIASKLYLPVYRRMLEVKQDQASAPVIR